jgi:DNA-binding NarL/FixJ family response regulator
MLIILILEDHPMMADAVKASLRDLPYKTKILIANTVRELQTEPVLMALKAPSLIISDLNLPDSQGLATVKLLQAQYPESPILVFSQLDDPTLESRIMALGALGFVSKSYQPKVFIAKIRAVAATLQNKQLQANDLQENTSADHLMLSLTSQQHKVLTLIANGLISSEVASQLEVTEATIRAHLTEIYSRLNVKNRTQASLFYSQWASRHDT